MRPALPISNVIASGRHGVILALPGPERGSGRMKRQTSSRSECSQRVRVRRSCPCPRPMPRDVNLLSLQERSRAAGDGLGADAVVTVEIGARARLPEVVHAERELDRAKGSTDEAERVG